MYAIGYRITNILLIFCVMRKINCVSYICKFDFVQFRGVPCKFDFALSMLCAIVHYKHLDWSVFIYTVNTWSPFEIPRSSGCMCT